jgi:hypothetical protein
VGARGSTLLAALTGFVAACFGAGVFPCEGDGQCDLRAEGRCEDSGYCSYPDGACPSGRAYDGLAPAALAGECVADSLPGTSTTTLSEESSTGTTTTSPSEDSSESTTGCQIEQCEDRDGDGHGVGVDCAGPDCDDDNPARSTGCKYIAPPPFGYDGNSGTRQAPWGTFEHALAQLAPGDSLVLDDGTYEASTTGLPVIDCGAGTAMNGLGPDMPISIRADHERRANLLGDGSTPALSIDGCSFWNVTGLAGRTDDFEGGASTTVMIDESQDVRARRLLFSHANRWADSKLYSITNSTNVLLEESEGYWFHEQGITVTDSTAVTLRRCYLNSREYEDHPDASSEVEGAPPVSSPNWTGDYGILMTGSGHRVENCILQGRVGIGVSVGRPGPNEILGTIIVDADRGVYALTEPRLQSMGHVLRDVVLLRSYSHQIYLRSVADVQLDGITMVGGAYGGLFAEELSTALCASFAGGCSFSGRHVLSLDHAGSGVSAAAAFAWELAHSNAFGNDPDYTVEEPIDDAEGFVRFSTSEPADEIGLALGQCAVFIPPGSSMSGKGENGADIGANVLYRWVDGVLTDEPLWDPQRHVFPCGAIREGLNDMPGDSCVDVHHELNVGSNGCSLPVGYATPSLCE